MLEILEHVFGFWWFAVSPRFRSKTLEAWRGRSGIEHIHTAFEALTFVFGAAISIAALGWLLVAPIPPDRVLSEEPSPDGRYIATFAWRPAGLVGAVTGDNPWVYATIEDVDAGVVVERHRVWGDVREDAYARLGPLIPWHRAR